MLDMFKSNRGKRYKVLIHAGFRPFEARWLSTIPFAKHPAMGLIIRKRRKLLKRRVQEADRNGWNIAKRQRIWDSRTRKLYQRRHWVTFSDHPTGAGPAAGQANPFELYRHYERNEINPMPGDSKKPNSHGTGQEKRWVLDRFQILLFTARQAWKDGDIKKYQASVASLDKIIERASPAKQKQLKAVKGKLTRR